MEKCIGCELCAGVCPADCIYVRAWTTRPTTRSRPGERYGYVYEINYLRCIHCDLCVEACPTEAITESKLFEFSFTNRADAIYTKAELLVDDDGRPQHLPVGGLARGRRPAHLGLDAGHLARRATPPTRARCSGRASWATACGPPRAASRGRRDDAATGTKALRDCSSAPADEDIPLEHRGMRGRAWRAQIGAERNKAKMRKARGAPHGRPSARRRTGRAPAAPPPRWPAADRGRHASPTSSPSPWPPPIILVGAIGVVTSRNPVHAALSLVVTLFGVAVLFVEQQADFLAAVQVIVYAGAIVVLFLFVIMFLGVDRRGEHRGRAAEGPAAPGLPGRAWPPGRPARSGRQRTGSPAPTVGRRPTRGPAATWPTGQVGLHHLPVRLRGHRRPAGHRRGRCGGAGPPAGRVPPRATTARAGPRPDGGAGRRRRPGPTRRPAGTPASRDGAGAGPGPRWWP